jgi:hypothetical protein
VKRNQLDSPQMAGPITMADLDALIAKGVTRAAFHENGTLASIEVGPPNTQHDAPKTQGDKPVTPPRSATSRLVPRVSSD